MKEIIKKLNDIGFKKSGVWKICEHGINFEITEDIGEEEFLYCFVLNDENIIYLGSSIKSIIKRFNGYKNPSKSQRTNYKVNNEISDYLKEGKNINIYIFLTSKIDNCEYKGFKLNLALGLEPALIKMVSKDNEVLINKKDNPYCVNKNEKNWKFRI